MPQVHLSPAFWIAAIITLLVVILISVPGLAERADEFVQSIRRALTTVSAALWGGIKGVWTFSDAQQRHIRLVAAETKRRMVRQRRQQENLVIRIAKQALNQTGQAPVALLNFDQMQQEVEKEMGEWQAPEPGDIASAWFRRFVYFLLVTVCAAADFVLVSSRAGPLLFGGTTPGFLVPLLQNLQTISGVLFVSIAALSGMLISEYTSQGLAEVVRLSPGISDNLKRVYLSLSVCMFVINLVVIVSLAAAGVILQFVHTTILEMLLVITIGATVLVAIGIFLAWDGLVQILTGFASVLVGIPLILASALLGGFAALISAILQGLDRLGLWLRGLGRQGSPIREITPSDKEISVVGFGAEGSKFAVNVLDQFSSLYGQNLYLAGIHSKASYRTYHDKLEHAQSAEADVSVPANEPNPAAKLRANLERYYNANQVAQKTLAWIVYGDDLNSCLSELRQLTQNIAELKLVILWILPRRQTISRTMRACASQLKQWAEEADSQLATTLLLRQDSPLETTMDTNAELLMAKSIAALLGASYQDTTAQNFGTLVDQIKSADHPFSALASGSIGVRSTQNTRVRVGLPRSGTIDPLNASNTLKVLADVALKSFDPELTTVPDQLIATLSDVSVNVVIPQFPDPTKLESFRNSVSGWLQADFQIFNVSVVEARDAEHDIDVHTQVPEWEGDRYPHLTVLFGIETGTSPTGMPQDLG